MVAVNPIVTHVQQQEKGFWADLAFCRLSMAVCSCDRCLGSASSDSTSSTMLPSSNALCRPGITIKHRC